MNQMRKAKRSIKHLLLGIPLFSFALIATSTLAANNEEITACKLLRLGDFSQLEQGNAAISITNAEYVPSQTLDADTELWTYKYSRLLGAPIPKGINSLPEHCLVEGYAAPTIRFQLRLPMNQVWNQRFLLNACMGFCGEVSNYPTMAGVMRNYATMSHDGGHTAAGFDGLWAKNNVPLREDFAYRANHVVAVAAKAVIERFYSKQLTYSFISGCSKGGHAGIMAAKRYPNDFDGVIARGPTINYTKVNLINCMDNAKAILDENDNALLDASYTDFISQAVMQACDHKDGLVDGLISDPRRCDFDPQTLLCSNNTTGKCLTPRQVNAIKDIYAPSYDQQGNVIYGGLPYGSEPEWTGWLFPEAPFIKPYHYYAATEYLKYLAFPRERYNQGNWRDFSYNNEAGELSPISSFMDADHPDLTGFKNSGGKMIVLHGWSDAAIPAYATIDWYESVINYMGKDNTYDFARLFLPPGLVHCGIEGPGAETFDAIAALVHWLDTGIAPDALMTQKEDPQGNILFTRPVYPYPQEAQYIGTGDPKKAENFRPRVPNFKSN